MYLIGGGSHKPSSAPGKSRLRSNSPSAALQHQQDKKKIAHQAVNFTYSNPMSTVGTSGLSKMGGPHPLYRGYSPSKPKWKNGGNMNQNAASNFGQSAYQASQAMMG